MLKFFSFFLCCSLFLIPIGKVFPGCDDSFYDQCAISLGDYSFLKSFQLDEKLINKYGVHPTIKYTSVFSKNTEYLFTICDQVKTSNVRMVLKLYDSNNHLITSTYEPNSNRYFSKFKFPCKATGVYYLEFSFSSKYIGCGLSIIGIKLKS